MSRCSICNTLIYGTGSLCALHKSTFRRSRTLDYYDYSSESSHPANTNYRTSQGSAGVAALHRPRHRDGYNNGRALALYSSDRDPRTTTTALATTLSQSFTTLQDAHVVSSLTYTITPDGTQTVTAQANLEREQCMICFTWFPNREKLDYHQWEYPIGCAAHGICMRTEDALWHGTNERHERCFLQNCSSVYRREGGWRSSVVEKHVKAWHR